MSDPISSVLRDVLIEHIDGPVLIRVNEPARHSRLRGAVQTGLLHFDQYQPPRQTFITAKGRAALAQALADWADALVRARRTAGFCS